MVVGSAVPTATRSFPQRHKILAKSNEPWNLMPVFALVTLLFLWGGLGTQGACLKNNERLSGTDKRELRGAWVEIL